MTRIVCLALPKPGSSRPKEKRKKRDTVQKRLVVGGGWCLKKIPLVLEHFGYRADNVRGFSTRYVNVQEMRIKTTPSSSLNQNILEMPICHKEVLCKCTTRQEACYRLSYLIDFDELFVQVSTLC